jgi:hypothetical protein
MLLRTKKEASMGSLKRNVAAIVGGTLVLAGGTYAGARALSVPPQVTLDAASNAALEDAVQPAQAPEQEKAERKAGPRGPMIRGEGVVGHDGEFPTVRFNRGVLSTADGTTLVIDEADGTTVRVATDEETRFRRDREKATISDLKAGDHVATLEVKDGDDYSTKFVRAFSAEKWDERQSNKQERRQHRNRGQ